MRVNKFVTPASSTLVKLRLVYHVDEASHAGLPRMVMYIDGGFKRAGNSGLVWLCAETSIHEVTHLELCTKDFRIDAKGAQTKYKLPRNRSHRQCR